MVNVKGISDKSEACIPFSILPSVYCPYIKLPSGDWQPILPRMSFRLVNLIVEIMNSPYPHPCSSRRVWSGQKHAMRRSSFIFPELFPLEEIKGTQETANCQQALELMEDSCFKIQIRNHRTSWICPISKSVFHRSMPLDLWSSILYLSYQSQYSTGACLWSCVVIHPECIMGCWRVPTKLSTIGVRFDIGRMRQLD